jgi:DNA-binding transcriptional regulator YbjK
MRRNPERRTALLDAAIEVLALNGARGLTFRAVDTAAGVPQGTVSNYFTSRDDLLNQVARRVYERLAEGASTAATRVSGPPSRDQVTALMHDVVDRVTGFREGYLALLELRLEATRRPHLRALLAERIQEDIDANIAYHIEAGLPGDATTVMLLYLAISWLIVERLTLPEMFSDTDVRDLVEKAVERIVPDA